MKNELNAYEILKTQNIDIPKLIEVNKKDNYIIKEYIDGNTLSTEISRNNINIDVYLSFYLIAKDLENNGINIDYFPTNFIYKEDKIYYIDYEVNRYTEEWNFMNWGIYFWFNCEGFKRYHEFANDHTLLVDSENPSKPLKQYTQNEVNHFKDLVKKLNVLELKEI